MAARVKEDSKPEVIVYTDGACSGNPGPRGWAAVLRYGDHEREIPGGDAHTTNQRMEMTAAVEALRALDRPCRVRLHSDSAYLVNCVRQRWYDNWIRNGWKSRNKTPVQNRDLWEELIRLGAIHDTDWIKVAGHSGDVLNERCDRLARAEAERAARCSRRVGTLPPFRSNRARRWNPGFATDSTEKEATSPLYVTSFADRIRAVLNTR